MGSGQPGLERGDFAAAYFDAVHGGLDRVLGKSATSAVLFHMKMTKDMPKPDVFEAKLLALFGVQGALSLERAVLKDLATRLNSPPDLLAIEGVFDFQVSMRTLEKGESR